MTEHDLTKAVGTQSDAPLHVQVRQRLENQIANMQVGDRLPSERKLSNNLKVAAVTVRRAMVDLAQEGFVVRHPGRGTFVRKTVRHHVQPSVASKSIALIVPDTALPCNCRLIDALTEEIAKHDYRLLIYDCQMDTTQEEALIRKLSNENLGGLMVCPFHENSLSDSYAQLIAQVEKSDTPLVLLDQYIPGLETPAVVTNHMLMGYMATEHLIMLGHSRIAFASTGRYDVSGLAAVNGYRHALEDYHIPYDEKLTIEFPIEQCAEPTQKAVTQILHQNLRAFTAIATSQFSMTFGIINALNELKLRCPKDIALVGSETYHNPSLDYVTNMRQPIEEMGQQAVRILLGKEEMPSMKRHLLLRPKLLIRQSCGMKQTK